MWHALNTNSIVSSSDKKGSGTIYKVEEQKKISYNTEIQNNNP